MGKKCIAMGLTRWPSNNCLEVSRVALAQLIGRLLSCTFAFLILIGTSIAADGDGFVEWVTPATPVARPRSDEEKALGIEQGRPPPAPEFLQPALDSALPAYRPHNERSLRGRLRAAASDILPGLVHAWITEFQAFFPDIEIDLSPPYAGSLGALELIEGNIDLAFVSRELKPTDIASFQEEFEYPPLSIPIVGGSYRHYGFLDALAVFVHESNPLKEISLKLLDATFSTTLHRGGAAVETWGDLGLTGDWATQPVSRYGVKPWNGFEEFFRQRVLNAGGRRGEWRTDVNFDKLVFPTAGRVALDPNAIGYTGIAYLNAPVRILPIRVAGTGPVLAPSYDNVASAAYPLSRLIYLNFNRPPGEPVPAAIAEFVRFILSAQGQQLVLEHGVFLPLRAKQVVESLEYLD